MKKAIWKKSFVITIKSILMVVAIQAKNSHPFLKKLAYTHLFDNCWPCPLTSAESILWCVCSGESEMYAGGPPAPPLCAPRVTEPSRLYCIVLCTVGALSLECNRCSQCLLGSLLCKNRWRYCISDFWRPIRVHWSTHKRNFNFLN